MQASKLEAASGEEAAAQQEQGAPATAGGGLPPLPAVVPVAVTPPEPSLSQAPHLLTPSQIMQASRSALPRSASQVINC